MDFMTIKQASEKWGICTRRVQTLCTEGRIDGAERLGHQWVNSLQVCLDSGTRKVLLPITSAADLGTVPPELVGSFNLIFYSSAEDAVFKALGVE